MAKGVGHYDVFPSIWGRKCIRLSIALSMTCTNRMLPTDWAGGPGDSKDDVEWLDKKLAKFFAEN